MLSVLKPLPDPDVTFLDRRLVSKRFKDIYFAADGPAETRRVFLEPTNLLQRIEKMTEFTIFEFGFGTGLNFLELAEQLKTHKPTCRVRYISVEKFPLNRAEIETALTPFRAELSEQNELLDALPPRVSGWHRRFFSSTRLELTLCYADIRDAVEDFIARDQRGVDAWFLDGFSPERNPEMWEPALLRRLAKRTKQGGSVTSFSAAGHLRRVLSESGFDVSRVSGDPGKKRHTTVGLLHGEGFRGKALPNAVRVIGGGLAGCSVAHALAKKGVNVRVLERSNSLASQTSAISVAVQHPRLSAAETLQALYRVHAYAHAQYLCANSPAVSRSGAYHLPDEGMTEDRLRGVAALLGCDWCEFLNEQDTIEHSSALLRGTAAFHPKSCIVRGASLCKWLADLPNINVVCDSSIDLTLPSDECTVYATGESVPHLSVGLPLEVTTIEGQVDTWSLEPPLKESTIVVRDGYVAFDSGLATTGSTYEYRPWKTGEATKENRKRLDRLKLRHRISWHSTFRATRVVSSDRCPITGNVAPHTWVSWAHGSSGTVSAPFAGEVIASQVVGEIPIGVVDFNRIYAPERFAERQTRRPSPFL